MTRDDVFKAIDVADAAQLREILSTDPSLASSRSNDGLSAVLFSLYIDKPDITEVLLEFKPELDIYDLSGLGQVDKISHLLALEPKSVHEFSGDGFTALHVASYFGWPDAVKLLLENGTDVNKVAMNGSDLTPLQSAVSRQHKEVVSVLLEFNPEIDVQMLGGFTPLMMAAALGAKDIVMLLLEKGADKTLTSEDGRTAGAFAKSAGHNEIEYLFSN